ncbi:MAG: GNAT family N-acetyltransferase [Lachnospiraceae bacterium]|nr:GNAT family N-acetyltransferase [Lachnospiraceae bacterium]
MSLCYQTFLRFDAAAYTDEGIENFREFVSDHSLKRMFDAGSYQVIGAFEKGRLVGVISLRNNSHISLLFVDSDHHRRGIGTELVYALASYVREKLHETALTVNAAPYAVGFYHRIGFYDLGGVVTQDGITFTPMKLELELVF